MSAVLNGANSRSVRGFKIHFTVRSVVINMWLMNDHEYLNEGVGLVCYCRLQFS